MSGIVLNDKDNVAVVFKDINKGSTVTVENNDVIALEDIPAANKIALRDIKKGEYVIKYGNKIGCATEDILKGAFVHVHNVKTTLKGLINYSYNPIFLSSDDRRGGNGDKELSTAKNDYFYGYIREDGSVGIRNEIWIINTVGCVNKTSEIIARAASARYFDKEIDGIFSFAHPYGCSQLGDDHFTTQKILAGLVSHPNAGGVLVLGLGCENNNITEFKKVLGEYNQERVLFLNSQDVEDEIEEAVGMIGNLIDYASEFKRQKTPVNKLKVGLKCGASDGFSGITANPLVGSFSDMLVSKKGSVVLTEVPEMFGAETLLMDRCKDKQTFEKCVDMINGFKEYFTRHNQPIYENPSPGNKKGGITTLEEKSLGCILKGGTSEVIDILGYGERIKQKGLSLMYGPGNDIVSTTALAASGVQLVLFTTGRGNPLGGPVPTVKISTNSKLAKLKHNWIDFNAGSLVEGNTMTGVCNDFYNRVVDIASGKNKAKNELNGYRQIAIFKDGVTL